MRIKIYLDDITKLEIKKNCLTVSSLIHKFLGANNKWHNEKEKQYSVSMILGGKKDGKGNYIFDEHNEAHIFINTSNQEIATVILTNINGIYKFEIVSNTIRKGLNMLNVYNVRYGSNGTDYNIDTATQEKFETYLKNRYGIDAKVVKNNCNIDVHYKNNSVIKSTNILLKVVSDNIEDIQKLFDNGIGGSTGLGFGFVTNINLKKNEVFEN